METVVKVVRPLVLCSLAGTVVYLALIGNEKAIDALLVQFATLAGAHWGERAALMKPQDSQGG
jgi:hypothetical protein